MIDIKVMGKTLNYKGRSFDSCYRLMYCVEQAWVVGVFAILIQMSRFILMENSRLLLDQEAGEAEQFSLKICTNRQIARFPAVFRWEQQCRRWQGRSQVKFQHFETVPVELQLYLLKDELPIVIAEGIVYPTILEHHLNEEVKILFNYDGIVIGQLYCQFSIQGEKPVVCKHEQYLSIQKMSLEFLEESEEEFKLKITQNAQCIWEKGFRLNQRSKTLFPSLRKSVKVSDMVRVQIQNEKFGMRPVFILIDNMRRGRTTNYESWVRNKKKNKVGNIHFQYFLQNIFLCNQRQAYSRKALNPFSLQYAKTIAAKRINDKEITTQQSTMSRLPSPLNSPSHNQIQDVEKRILKINNNVNKMIEQVKVAEQVVPSLKKARIIIKKRQNSNATTQKLAFYFATNTQNIFPAS